VYFVTDNLEIYPKFRILDFIMVTKKSYNMILKIGF